MCLSLFSLHSDNKVEETGVLCVEKVDLIACDLRKEPPIRQESLESNYAVSDPSLGSFYAMTEPT